MPTLPSHYVTPQWPRSLAKIAEWNWSEPERRLSITLLDDMGYEVPMVIALVRGGIYFRFGPAPHRPYSLLIDEPVFLSAEITQQESAILLTGAETTVAIGMDAPRPFLTVMQSGSDRVWSTAPLGAGCVDEALYRGQGTGTPGMAWLDAELLPGEALYGLGERFNSFNLRGQKVSLWAEDAFGLPGQETYINTPWLMSTAGWGIFLPTAAASVWDIGHQHGSTLRITVAESAFEAYLLFGDLPALLRRYLTLTGKPALPPDWSYGLWMSRWGYASQDEVLAVADQLIVDQIPVSVLHLDPLWLTEKNGHTCTYEWDRDRFPDPEKMIRDLKARNIRLSLWINPFLPRDSAIYRQAKAQGYLVLNQDGDVARLPRFDDDSGVIDFTNADAREWFKSLLRPLLDLGVAVFKSDFGETAPFEQARYANGIAGKAGHNLNALYYQRSVYEATAEYYPLSPMVWGRSGYAGIQRYPLQWGGDTGVTWEYMQKALRGGLTYSLSGAAFTAFDVGGFAGTPTEAVYLRWAAMGFFFSHIRAHGTSPREPEAFGPNAVRIFRSLARDRQTLMPYLWECAEQSVAEGLPLVRPLVLMHPDNPAVQAIDFEYYLGPDILVAPTVSPRAWQTLYLPQGTWRSLYHPDQVFQGGTWHRVQVPPLDEIWCFIRHDAKPTIASCPIVLGRG